MTKWTLEKLKEEALKYETRSEFSENSGSAYRTANKKSLLNEICRHMKKQIKWSLETLQREALKYNTRNEFSKNSGSAYGTANKKGFLDEICKHMKKQVEWSLEMLQKEASKYKSRSEFCENNRDAYLKACKWKMLDEICSHMERKIYVKWTLETLQIEALKYKTRGEFSKNSNAYNTARKLDLLDIICSHMKKKGNYYQRAIYAFEFSNNYVYIGLTCDLDRRREEHLSNKKGAVYQCLKKTNIQPVFKVLTSYVDVEKAMLKEEEFLNKYKDEGWATLNKNKTGGIGRSIRIWNRDNLLEEALRYSSRIEFSKSNSGAYNVAHRRGILNEICSHMKKEVYVKWNKEDLLKETSKYSSKIEFMKSNSKAYQAARRLGILDEVCKHMKQNKQTKRGKK